MKTKKCFLYTSLIPHVVDAENIAFELPSNVVLDLHHNVGASGSATFHCDADSVSGVNSIRFVDSGAPVNTPTVAKIKLIFQTAASVYSTGIPQTPTPFITSLKNITSSSTLSSFISNSSGMHPLTVINLENAVFSNTVYDRVIFNTGMALIWTGTENVGGNLLPKTELVYATSSGWNNGVASLPLHHHFRGKYLGFLVRTNPERGGTLLVKGEEPVSIPVLNSSVYVIVENSDALSLHWFNGTSSSKWVFANMKSWDDGEPPCFVVVTSTNFSSEVWRVIAFPTINGAPLQFTLNTFNYPIKAIYAKNATNDEVLLLENNEVVLQIPANMSDFQWFYYKSLASKTTYVVKGTQGTFELDVANLSLNLFPNYNRLLGILAGMPTVVRVEPDDSVLPQERYIVYLNGTLHDIMSTYNRLLYLNRSFMSEGFSVVLRLDKEFSVLQMLQHAVMDLVGALNIVSAFESDDTIYLNVFCATAEEETIIFARVSALVKMFKEMLVSLYPPTENVPEIVVSVIHRR